MYRIVETDNFGGDYPDECFLIKFDLPKTIAEQIVSVLNSHFGENDMRYYRVVEMPYKLKPGFEP